MTDLSTRYMGLELRNPLVASPSPLSLTIDGLRQLADCGVSAVVLFSLFEEQLRERQAEIAEVVEHHAESFPEAIDYLPESAKYGPGLSSYLRLLEKSAATLDIPVIGSLNGFTPSGWTSYARAIEESGAAAIELNIYYLPGEATITGREVEHRHLMVLERVKQAVSIPVAVKLSPYFSSIGEMAMILDRAGADALVLFNRFLQPDIDPEELTILPKIGLSTPAEGRLPRIWISLLRRRIKGSLAATSGVETSADIARYLLAGADVVMTTSALLRHGTPYAAELLDGLTHWMKRKGFSNIDELRGLLAAPPQTDQEAYQRAGYVTAMHAANVGDYIR